MHAWWITNMDAKRSISLLLGVSGLALAVIGIAASPVPLEVGSSNVGLVVLIIGAGIGGYVRQKVAHRQRALLSGLAYGVMNVAALVAAFGTAVLIRPTVRGVPGLADASSGVVVGGLLVAFIGGFLWERDPRKRPSLALGLLAGWLIVGGIIANTSEGPWAWLGGPAAVSGLVVLLLAFVVSPPFSDRDPARPAV